MSKYSITHAVSTYSTHGILIKNVGMNRCVLDVGCNEGYLGKACDKSNSFYGIDYDPLSLTVAKKNYLDVALIDLNQSTQLPWKIKFDLIIFGDILEHLLDPQSTFRALVYDYLKPGGEILLSLPNIANWQVRLSLLLGKFDYQETGILDRTHLHFFTYKTAREMFENDRIKICQVTGGSNILGAIIHYLPVLKSLLAHTIIMQLTLLSNPG